jgi:hypothetical protein
MVTAGPALSGQLERPPCGVARLETVGEKDKDGALAKGMRDSFTAIPAGLKKDIGVPKKSLS